MPEQPRFLTHAGTWNVGQWKLCEMHLGKHQEFFEIYAVAACGTCSKNPAVEVPGNIWLDYHHYQCMGNEAGSVPEHCQAGCRCTSQMRKRWVCKPVCARRWNSKVCWRRICNRFQWSSENSPLPCRRVLTAMEMELLGPKSFSKDRLALLRST